MLIFVEGVALYPQVTETVALLSNFTQANVQYVVIFAISARATVHIYSPTAAPLTVSPNQIKLNTSPVFKYPRLNVRKVSALALSSVKISKGVTSAVSAAKPVAPVLNQNKKTYAVVVLTSIV